MSVNYSIYHFFFIIDCLRHFTENELLSENDQYYCDKCKGKQPSTKKLSIRRLPNVSVSQLDLSNKAMHSFKSSTGTLYSFKTFSS